MRRQRLRLTVIWARFDQLSGDFLTTDLTTDLTAGLRIWSLISSLIWQLIWPPIWPSRGLPRQWNGLDRFDHTWPLFGHYLIIYLTAYGLSWPFLTIIWPFLTNFLTAGRIWPCWTRASWPPRSPRRYRTGAISRRFVGPAQRCSFAAIGAMSGEDGSSLSRSHSIYLSLALQYIYIYIYIYIYKERACSVALCCSFRSFRRRQFWW
jgi:hypothetical protein